MVKNRPTKDGSQRGWSSEKELQSTTTILNDGHRGGVTLRRTRMKSYGRQARAN